LAITDWIFSFIVSHPQFLRHLIIPVDHLLIIARRKSFSWATLSCSHVIKIKHPLSQQHYITIPETKC